MNDIQVYLNQYNVKISPATNVDQQLKGLFGDLSVDWIFVKDNFTLINIDSYPGFTKMQKFELFLAHYSTNEIVEQF